jgi:hypothetical protein
MARILLLVMVCMFAVVNVSIAISQGSSGGLYGIDFTRPYLGMKDEMDTRTVDGREFTLYRIDPGLGGQSYLVETSDGEICEFATILPVQAGSSAEDAFGLLGEMQGAAEDKYGAPSMTAGPDGNVSEVIWTSGEDEEGLPSGVASLELSLGWSDNTPVALFLKANHHRCEGLSALGLP